VLAPASASAMVSQGAGACIAIPIGPGLIKWQTSGGDDCTPTYEDYLRSGIGDQYDVGNLPGDPYAGLNLPDDRNAGELPDREQSIRLPGWLTRPFKKAPKKVPRKVPKKVPREEENWGWEVRPKPMTTWRDVVPKGRLSKWDCIKFKPVIAELQKMAGKALAAYMSARDTGGAPDAVEALRQVAVAHETEHSQAASLYKLDCTDLRQQLYRP
jgi:hypothetical protein